MIIMTNTITRKIKYSMKKNEIEQIYFKILFRNKVFKKYKEKNLL